MESDARELASKHLLLRLAPLKRALRAKVARRHAAETRVPQLDAIGRQEADTLLDDLDANANAIWSAGAAAELTTDELVRERELCDLATASGTRLPLQAMAADLELDPFELEVLVLCAAIELDGSYERVFAYIHGDPTRNHVSIELACGLTAAGIQDRMRRRLALGPVGRLRRLGMVDCAHEARSHGVLSLRPDTLHALLGGRTDLRAAFRDPAQVTFGRGQVVAADGGLIDRIASRVRTGDIDLVAMWGDERHTRSVLAELAACVGCAVRRYPVPEVEPAAAVAVAGALGAALWVDLDAFEGRPARLLVEVLRATVTPVFLSGAHAWRPTELLCDRKYIEIPLEPSSAGDRRGMWRAALPDLAPERLVDLAATYRFNAAEVRAASRLARMLAELRTNGHACGATDCVAEACAIVARRDGERHTTLVTPRRGRNDLILPPEQHQRVLDIALYHRAAARVMDEWGFGRRVTSAGIKALFTGEPGTGKTLAAEVVAFELGLPLLKVDLARVVSKWVGETEKNLDSAFHEAETSHAVLFFDEAEALFGNRAEVRHGSDRYANLEVSYLLQRLEAYDGVVILATNLRDKIDQAFMRRFHVVVGFGRPTESERRRMWKSAFPPTVPVTGDLDVAALAKLDLTGAGIVGAAQTAAYLAAGEGVGIAMSHVVGGLVRQYQREARVLNPRDLGAHAVHLRAS